MTPEGRKHYIFWSDLIYYLLTFTSGLLGIAIFIIWLWK